MKSLRLLPLLLIVFALGLPTPGRAESDAPYIYYYSDLLQGWVIERADGTDGRVIGREIQQEDYYFSDVAWSPSGRWMTWRSAAWCGPCEPGFEGWAMRTDGSKVMSTFSNIRGRVWSMAWSPVEDLLFATYDDRSNAPQELGFILTIIDPETEGIVAQTEIGSSYFLYPTEHGWLEDGSGIYAISHEGRDATIITILYKDGRVSTKVFQFFYPIQTHVQHGRVYSSRMGPLGPIPSIQDLMTDRVLVTDERDPNINPTYHLIWNEDMTTALQSKLVCPEPGCYYANVQIALELIDWQTGKRTRLPDYLRFSNLYGIDQLFALSNYDPPIYNQSWSPDGTRLIFVDNQESGQLYLVEAATGVTTPLSNFTNAYTWQWAGSNALLIQRKDVQFVQHTFPTYHYDLESHDIRHIGNYRFYEVSPSGRYIGVGSVVDTETGRNLPVIPNGNPCPFDIDYLWNEPETWFLTGEPAACMDGGGSYGGISIHSMNNTVQRELTLCSEVGTCAGFLPERAIPHLSASQAESVFVQPEAVLGTASSHDWIVSWSPDSRFLATGSQSPTQAETGRNSVSFWDMTEAHTLTGSAETLVDCRPSCTVQWSADAHQMEWIGNTITEVWDSTTGQLLRRERHRLPPPQPIRYGVRLPSPTEQCDAALRLRPNPVEPNSTLAWVDNRWVRFNSGTQGCSRDGEWLLVLNSNTIRSQLTAVNPQAIHTFDLGERPLHWSPMIEYQPGSPLFIANTYGPNYATRMELFDIEYGQWLTVPINFFARDAALSPDGRWIAAAGAQTVTIWDIAKIRARQVVE